MSANAWFTNIDTEPFGITWNGKTRLVQPGETKLFPSWYAEHGAKHLTNHMLLKSGKPGYENYTSPKRPSEVPVYMEFFNKIYKLYGTTEEAQKHDELDAEIELLNAVHKPEEEEVKEDEKEAGVIKPEPEEEFDTPAEVVAKKAKGKK